MRILIKRFLIINGILILFLVSLMVAFYLYFLDRIYPGISVAGVSLTGLTKIEAEDKLEQLLKIRVGEQLTFIYQNQQSNIDISQAVTNLNTKEVVSDAFSYGHQKLYFSPMNLSLVLNNDKFLNDQIYSINEFVNQPSIEAQIKVESGLVSVTPSQEGLVLDEEELTDRLIKYINTGMLTDNKLPMKKAIPNLSYEDGLKIKGVLDKVKISSLKLTFQDQFFTLDFNTLLGLIDLDKNSSSLTSADLFGSEFNISQVTVGEQTLNDPQISLKKDQTNKYLANLSLQIDRPVREPLFEVQQTSDQKISKVTQFSPPQEGWKLNINSSEAKLAQAINAISKDNIPVPDKVELVVDVVQPKNKLTNELGIKELIGRGVSNYSGSIPNRIYNIELAASRINGVLIAPGEVFSFVKTVGDISAATGYKQAYVIQSGRTVLGDGGGVCQVSTTLFRSVLNSGLPIVNRVAHAYRVGYYEQGFPPGLDATIYYPSVDFQFKNDTPAYVLIQAYTQGTTLYVDFYGTSDGRVAEVSKPVITSQTPAPPELRQDDPTLPKGEIKQVDFAAVGANVVFKRTVKRDNQVIINDTFKSNYRPWQAVYLIGTKEN